MKKYLFMVLMACMFVGCSSDGSREIQIDEMKFVSGSVFKLEESKIISSIFEVVPGKYELSWKIVDDMPQMKYYDIVLKLKLRLKKTVNLKKEVIESISNINETNWANVFVTYGDLFAIYLIDENGNNINETCRFDIQSLPIQKLRKEKVKINTEALLDFYRFIQSKPGTEIELVMYGKGRIAFDGTTENCVEDCKNARGIICIPDISDTHFLRDIGSIQ